MQLWPKYLRFSPVCSTRLQPPQRGKNAGVKFPVCTCTNLTKQTRSLQIPSRRFGQSETNLPRGEAAQVRRPGCPLTSTDAPGHRHVIAVVALQPFVAVTWSGGAAVLVELRGAHLAAAASVHQRADTRGAALGLLGALAQCRAAGAHLDRADRVSAQWTQLFTLRSVVHIVRNFCDNPLLLVSKYDSRFVHCYDACF